MPERAQNRPFLPIRFRRRAGHHDARRGNRRPPHELADAIGVGEHPDPPAVIVCRLPNTTFDDISDPVVAVPSHPISVPKNGYSIRPRKRQSQRCVHPAVAHHEPQRHHGRNRDHREPQAHQRFAEDPRQRPRPHARTAATRNPRPRRRRPSCRLNTAVSALSTTGGTRIATRCGPTTIN